MLAGELSAVTSMDAGEGSVEAERSEFEFAPSCASLPLTMTLLCAGLGRRRQSRERR